MDNSFGSSYRRHLRVLIGSRSEDLARLVQSRSSAACALTIIAGGGLYGSTIGIWRSPLQALYAGIKLPAVILLTVAATALVNGVLSQIIGTRLNFREGCRAVLASFAVCSAVLGALSPVLFFSGIQCPPFRGT